MDNNLIGIITSFLFVFIIIGISTFLTKKGIISGEGSRKFIHIGVCNWWILAMILFDNKLYASIVPAVFVILNYLSYKLTLIKAMERDGSKKDLGTVYYAISLFVLAIFTLGNFETAYIGAIGIMAMGYGDGLAAVVGTVKGKREIRIGKNTKTMEGTTTMFLVTLAVTLIIILLCTTFNLITVILYSLIVSVVATALELITPQGLDNLSVPLLSSLVYYVLLIIR